MVNKTQSELIIFFVILLIAIVPLYSMILKGNKVKSEFENTRQDKYIEREKQIIQVITDNTQVIAGLKATLDISNTTINTSLNRILDHEGEQKEKMAQVQVTLDRNTANQVSMMKDIREILLIIDNFSHNSNFDKSVIKTEQHKT